MDQASISAKLYGKGHEGMGEARTRWLEASPPYVWELFRVAIAEEAKGVVAGAAGSALLARS